MLLMCGIISSLPAQALSKPGFFSQVNADSTLIRAPVVFKDKVIFYVYTDYGPFSQLERSVIVNSRLADLSNYKHLDPDSLRIVEGNKELTIEYNHKPIFAVTSADSLIFQKPVSEIAAAYYNILATEFIPLATHLSMQHRILLIGRTILFIMGILIITLFAFKLLGKFLKSITSLFEHLRRKHHEGMVVRGLRVASAEQLSTSARMIINFIRFVAVILISYFSLYMVLLAIPATRTIARQLQAYIANPIESVGNGILRYLPNLFFILVIIFIAKYVIQFLRFLFKEIGNGNIHLGNFYSEWADTTYQIIKFLIFFFVIIIVFPYLPGSNSPAFIGVSIFVGVLFSLGSTSAIANIIAGIILTYMRAYRVGSMIKVGDQTGELIETTLLVIRIRTPKNEVITIPNSIVLSGHITNYSVHAEDSNLVLHTKVTIGYDVPWQKVTNLLLDAAMRSDGVNKDKSPFVNLTSLGNYYVEYELNAYTKSANAMPAIYAELHRHILDTFLEANVEIMSPTYNAIRDGNAATVPSSTSRSRVFDSETTSDKVKRFSKNYHTDSEDESKITQTPESDS
jgi:small-conductance mechanosensitive channel